MAQDTRRWSALPLCALVVPFLANVAVSQRSPVQPIPAGVPAQLKSLVFGASKRPQVDLRIGDHAFRAIRRHGDAVCLLWSRNAEAPLSLKKDKATVAKWIDDSATALGLRDFRAQFETASTWRGADVWRFKLVRADVQMHDRSVRVYWDGDRFLGLWSDFPSPISAIDEPAATDRGRPDKVYFADRQPDASYRLVIATLERTQTKTHETTAIVTAKGTAYEIVRETTPVEEPASAAAFSEWSVPRGTFPDQIWADSTGVIWFSQPQDNLVTSFTPSTEKFKQYATTGGRGPDGLWVDDQDRVWTGLYFSSHLGFLEISTGKFTSIAQPYTPAALAIPSPAPLGTIWVTDHANNRISQYDPVQKKWLVSLVMPTPRTWVVQGVFDFTRETAYFTGNSSNTLPCKPKGKPIVDIPVASGGGPAFLVYNDDKIWFSLWSRNRLGVYDITTKRITEYVNRAGEVGGPIGLTPDGRPVVGTRGRGYIVVFDPVAKTFAEYKIPSATGLKDGLTVAPDGAIWFTGTIGTNKIARLVLK